MMTYLSLCCCCCHSYCCYAVPTPLRVSAPTMLELIHTARLNTYCIKKVNTPYYLSRSCESLWQWGTATQPCALQTCPVPPYGVSPARRTKLVRANPSSLWRPSFLKPCTRLTRSRTPAQRNAACCPCLKFASPLTQMEHAGRGPPAAAFPGGSGPSARVAGGALSLSLSLPLFYALGFELCPETRIFFFCQVCRSGISCVGLCLLQQAFEPRHASLGPPSLVHGLCAPFVLFCPVLAQFPFFLSSSRPQGRSTKKLGNMSLSNQVVSASCQASVHSILCKQVQKHWEDGILLPRLALLCSHSWVCGKTLANQEVWSRIRSLGTQQVRSNCNSFSWSLHVWCTSQSPCSVAPVVQGSVSVAQCRSGASALFHWLTICTCRCQLLLLGTCVLPSVCFSLEGIRLSDGEQVNSEVA
jgi:hypothetical protein